MGNQIYYKVETRLSNDEIYQISEIHQKNINGNLAILGVNFLHQLYLFFNERENVFNVLAYKDNKIIGFICFTLENNSIYSQFVSRKFFFLIFFLVKNLLNLKKILAFLNLFFLSLFNQKLTYEKELLSIAVMEKYQHKKLGSQMIQNLEDYLKKNKIFEFAVRTEKDNFKANNFYKKNLFVLVENYKGRFNLYLKKII